MLVHIFLALFHVVFVKLLNLDEFLTLLAIFSLALDHGLDSVILWWGDKPKIIWCIGLYHLLHIVIFIFCWLLLSSKWSELLFFRHREAVFIVQRIEVIENTWRSKHHVWVCFLHYWRHHDFRNGCWLLFLDAWLVHCLFKHFPCVLILLW